MRENVAHFIQCFFADETVELDDAVPFLHAGLRGRARLVDAVDLHARIGRAVAALSETR